MMCNKKNALSAATLFVYVSLVCLAGCANRNLYDLPEPPPVSERRNVSLIPGEDERRSEKDFQEARASLLRLEELLESKRYDEALGLMSQETVAMLEFISPDKKSSAPATAVFTLQEVIVDDVSYKVDPVALLLAPDLSDVQDNVEEQPKQVESSRRKELFAVQKAQGEGARKIVMIKEGDTWLLHRTRIDPQQK